MTAYYNEFDPKCAAWLRQLIKNGLIAPGEVDERSIIDVEASDLRGFKQHHFFAGIGVWSYALRNAGWSDNRPVCTASLPCQPFSTAGNQKGKDDERHLLPHFLELVRECGFNTIFGEQVEAAIRHGWLDDLQAAMERENYAIGHAVLGAHSINAAHQRQRLFWVAHSISARHERGLPGGAHKKRQDLHGYSGCHSTASGLGYTQHDGHFASEESGSNETSIFDSEKESNSASEFKRTSTPTSISSITSGVDWLYCKDGKRRPIKSSIKPLVNGLARGVVYRGGAIDPNNTALARSIRLKGYGNAINADVAREFISAYMDVVQ
tara:strand:+ start:189 stop:1157 length:969 start_codon:yes stop_codon:yes gene_type:complete